MENKGKQARIFKNEFLESLTKTTPSITIIFYTSVAASFLYLSGYLTNVNPGQAVALYFAGLVFWTFFEYIMHRYVFHYMGDFNAGRKLQYMVHGVHHEQPRDVSRIAMPPVPGLIIISVTFLLFYLVLGKFSFAFASGWITGYLLYSFIHMLVHISRPIKGLKFLWTHHNIHHFKDQEKAFGVSTPLWDMIFKTMPEKKASRVGIIQAEK